MDELSLFPVPVELLELIESGTDNNPEIFRINSFDSIEERTAAAAKRLHYLQVWIE
jgi:hypothetical protein